MLISLGQLVFPSENLAHFFMLSFPPFSNFSREVAWGASFRLAAEILPVTIPGTLVYPFIPFLLFLRMGPLLSHEPF